MVFLDNATLAFFYLATSLLFVLLAYYVWQRRDAPGSLFFAMLMVVGAVWSLGNLLQMMTSDIPLKILFVRLTYLGIVPSPVLWLLCNIAYGKRSRRLDRRLLLLWVVPIITLVLVFTNDWHHLFWKSVTIVDGSELVYAYGPGMWLHTAYSYTVMMAGTTVLALTMLRNYKRYFMQTFVLVLGSLLPFIGNIVYLLWLDRYVFFDPTPFTVALLGLFYAWSMFRYRLFDLVPIARETLVSEIVDGIVVLDDRCRIIDMNPAAREFLGDEARLGVAMESLFVRWPALHDLCHRTFDEPLDLRLEDDRSVRWVEARVSDLHDPGGHATGKLLMLRDITKRKIAEHALEESRNNFQTLFDSVDDLLFVLDSRGRIIEANHAAVDRLGYARDELVGGDPRLLVPQSQFDMLVAAFSHRLPDRPRSYPVTLIARGNTELRVEIHIASGLWKGQRAMFAIARDITVLMQHQEALQKSNLQLSTEVDERRRAEEQITASLREKDVLLKEIHHRVKNNLQIIISLQNLQMAGEKRPDVIAGFRESQNRIMSMALVHEKIYQSPDFSRVNFAEYADSLTSQLRRAYTKNPGIQLQLAIDPVFMSIDQSIPCGLIINELVTNSLKYAFPDGRPGKIHVGLARSGDRYTLTMSDDGVGLPPGFDFRSAPTLGLQLVATLVSQIDGSIELDAGPGTRFRISFPVK